MLNNFICKYIMRYCQRHLNRASLHGKNRCVTWHHPSVSLVGNIVSGCDRHMIRHQPCMSLVGNIVSGCDRYIIRHQPCVSLVGNIVSGCDRYMIRHQPCVSLMGNIVSGCVSHMTWHQPRKTSSLECALFDKHVPPYAMLRVLTIGEE